ncbi:Retrovirus-related Pol polyprotein from transposon 297 [Araneus ventricosus]|uniref:Retrovirus-related Pol polyprotein from transposon 297 n=1 Tax=Araneus ventricosus TaxID=182803 RepID=A0A4Y2GD82_ARAVE|nr:Retrovirus-related Pol polyprotein from transposon 297 [Araneus ventricosus]
METVLRGLTSEACLVYLDDIVIVGRTFEEHLNNIRKALITSPVLTYLRADKEFILDTDAGNEGIGAVLLQKIRNEECVIVYFSKSLGKPERNYCVMRKELLAIVKSIEHFHHFLYRRKFLLRTDYASLRWLLNFREPEGQIARWIQRLQEFNFEIQHRKGTSHGNADALSRRPCIEKCKQCTNAEKKFEIETDIFVKILTTIDYPWFSSEVKKAQPEDPAIRPILEKKLKSEDRTILARNSSGESCNKTILGFLGLLTP